MASAHAPPASLTRQVADVLANAATALVCGHVNPDGDALGSAFAIAGALRQMGTDVQVSWGGVDADTPPDPLDPSLSFLVGDLRPTPADRVRTAPDVLVCCDTASPGRLGTLAPLLDSARTVVVIDHHAVGDAFGDLRVVDPDASSTGALALDLLRHLPVELTPAIADALYLALLTDTGRFSYPSTRPSDLRAAAELIEAGADHTGIAQAVYASASRGYIGLVARVTARARLTGRMGWSWSTLEDLEETGAEGSENDGLIDLLRSVRDLDVTLFMRETPTGEWRCSLRSRGQTDVADIAAGFGGGGHRRAAGFRSHLDPPQIAQAVQAALPAPPAPHPPTTGAAS